jgi:hypothetical protein
MHVIYYYTAVYSKFQLIEYMVSRWDEYIRFAFRHLKLNNEWKDLKGQKWSYTVCLN